MRRTSLGFDTTDYVLDAFILPDLRSWEWKDEHEFAEAIAVGLFDRSEANRIRRATSRFATNVVATRREQLKRWVA